MPREGVPHRGVIRDITETPREGVRYRGVIRDVTETPHAKHLIEVIFVILLHRRAKVDFIVMFIVISLQRRT